MTHNQYNAFLKEEIVNIKDALDNNNLTIFAGARISLEYNLPSWQKLINKFKKSLNTQEKNFLKMVELFYEKK